MFILACILPYWGGVHIGDNVIVGANTLVSRDVPDNVVAVGNPARVVRSLEDYYQKRKKAEVAEAVQMIQEYAKRYGKEPPIEIMREHFWLFENDYESLIPEFKDVMHLVEGSFEKSCEKFRQHDKRFKDFDNLKAYALEVNGYVKEKS